MLDIFVPFWGDPQYLFKTVESVINQTSTNWRLTVVDDCYPDASVAEFFTKLNHPQITYLRNENNLGITDNYRKCVTLAQEELVVFLGCDDILRPNYVARVLELHSRYPDADIIQPGVEVIDAADKVYSPLADRVKRKLMPPKPYPLELSGEQLLASLLRANWMYWPSLVFAKERIKKTRFRDGFPIIQDLALVVDMVLAGAKMVLDDEIVFAYRRHNESASSATLFDGRRFSGEKRYFSIANSLAKQHGWNKAARAAKMHITSRAYAVVLLPTAIKQRNKQAINSLIRHIFA